MKFSAIKLMNKFLISFSVFSAKNAENFDLNKNFHFIHFSHFFLHNDFKKSKTLIDSGQIENLKCMIVIHKKNNQWRQNMKICRFKSIHQINNFFESFVSKTILNITIIKHYEIWFFFQSRFRSVKIVEISHISM